MYRTLKKWRQRWIGHVFDFKPGMSQNSRRAKLLNLFLLVTFTFIVVISVLNIARLFFVPSSYNMLYLIEDAVVVVILLGIWQLNQAGYQRWASLIYLLGAVFLVFLMFPPPELETVLALYAFPSVFASFILAPAASFCIATVVLIEYTIAYVMAEPGIEYNDVSMMGLFLLAFGAWLVASWMERIITEHWQAEEALRQAHAELELRVEQRTADLRESQSFYRSLVQVMPQSLCRKDLEGHFTFGNDRFCAGFGLTLKELIGETDFDLHPAEWAQVYRRDDRQVIETGEILDRIEEHVLADGTKSYVHVIKSPLRDDRDRITGVQIFYWDVSEQYRAQEIIRQSRDELELRVAERTAELERANAELQTEIIKCCRAEEELRMSEARFRTLVENVGEGIGQVEASGQFIFANPALEEIFAMPPGGMLERNVNEFLSSTSKRVLEAQVAQRQQGVNGSYELEIIRGDNETRILNITATPWYNKDHEYAGAFGAFRDVTEHRRAEREIQRHAEQLAALTAAAVRFQRSFESSEIYQIACDELCRLGEFASVWTLTPDGWLTHMHTSVSAPYSSEYAEFVEDRPLDFKLPLDTLKSVWSELSAGKTIVSQKLLREVIPLAPPEIGLLLQRINQRSADTIILLSPLQYGVAPIGVIFTLGEHLNALDIPAVALFARQVSVALENARLFDAEQTRREELGALYALSQELSKTDELDQIVRLVVHQAVETIHVTFVRLALIENDQLVIRAVFPVRALERDLGLGQRIPLSVLPRCARILAGNEPVVLTPRDVENEECAPLFLEIAKTICLVPMRFGDQVLGMLVFAEARHPQREPFDADKLRLARGVGNQAASAIRRANLHKQTECQAVELAEAYQATIEGWSRALDLRDNETEGHSVRVMEMTGLLARAFNLDAETIAHIRRGALLHDIGKMGLADAILRKPGELTADERALMEQHPRYAYEMLAPIAYLRPALDIPYCHHEKWDGSGYPCGLKGEDIPFSARLFAIVDVWDALTSDRSYRAAWSVEHASEYIADQSGKSFDPQVVQVFLGLVRDV